MTVATASRPKADVSLANRIQGCWVGKSIGGTLGLPAEGRTERLHYTFYDPVPTHAPPNDDLELQLVWLHMVENANRVLTQADFANAWIQHIHYMWDEYGRCRWNLRRGVPIEHVGTFENPFTSGMGSPIRSEIWACLFPGDPSSAAYYAALDASLDHGTEGIAGEVLFAVLQSLVASGTPIEEALVSALNHIAASSETARAVELVRAASDDGMKPWTCWQKLLRHHGNENFTHAPLNVALTTWALLYGEGDFEKSILLAVNAGYDTDCTAATVGATLGLTLGAQAIPSRWSDPLGEAVTIGPGILGIHAPKTLTELTRRTIALIGRLERKTGSLPSIITSPPDLANLPGTIFLKPHANGAAVPWANGELPESVKAAGGAEWTWEAPADEPHEIVCLTREGATLRIDGEVILRCPPGLPYVPAPHRCPSAARAQIRSGHSLRHLRLDLESRSPTQDATVILTYPNFHLCPWTKQELPLRAQL